MKSTESVERRVIVAGFGPVGRAVVQMLEAAGIRVTIVEQNSETVKTQSDLGKSTVLGDISDPQVLRQAGVADAAALILTIPDEQASFRACAEARRVKPGIFIAVRTNHVSGAMRAKQQGADHVTVQEVVTAESMRQAVRLHLVGDDER